MSKNKFLSGYDNNYNDSPYIEGYLDALCMIKQHNIVEDRVELDKAIEHLQRELI